MLEKYKMIRCGAPGCTNRGEKNPNTTTLGAIIMLL